MEAMRPLMPTGKAMDTHTSANLEVRRFTPWEQPVNDW